MDLSTEALQRPRNHRLCPDRKTPRPIHLDLDASGDRRRNEQPSQFEPVPARASMIPVAASTLPMRLPPVSAK